jgi:hypothetical protein
MSLYSHSWQTLPLRLRVLRHSRALTSIHMLCEGQCDIQASRAGGVGLEDATYDSAIRKHLEKSSLHWPEGAACPRVFKKKHVLAGFYHRHFLCPNRPVFAPHGRSRRSRGRHLGLAGACVKHSPPNRSRNASAVAASGKQNRM